MKFTNIILLFCFIYLCSATFGTSEYECYNAYDCLGDCRSRYYSCLDGWSANQQDGTCPCFWPYISCIEKDCDCNPIYFITQCEDACADSYCNGASIIVLSPILFNIIHLL